MNAATARALNVGDWVTASFGGRGVVKKCEIIAIDWPVFTLATKDYRGDQMIRTRRYVSLIEQVEPIVSITGPTPSWLTLPKEWGCE